MNKIKKMVSFFVFCIIIFSLSCGIIIVAVLPFIRYKNQLDNFTVHDRYALTVISKHAANSSTTLYQIYVNANKSDNLQLCDFVMMSKDVRKYSKVASDFSNTIVSEKVFDEYSDYLIQYKADGEFIISNKYSDPIFTITGRYKK